MKIIINADDLGYSKEINDAVFDLMSKRKLSSATIMANAQEFVDAIDKSNDQVNCSFGIHLNLTELKPLVTSQVMLDYGIANKKGFTGNIRNIKINKYVKKAIQVELEQQIIRILDAGIQISHIDSHHHIHTIPQLFPIIKKLQRKFKINKVRKSMNFYRGGYSTGSSKKLSKLLWNSAMKYCDHTTTTHYFTSIEYFANNDDFDVFDSNKVIEIMCHPSVDNSDYNILRSEEFNKITQQHDLICYNDI